MRNSMRGGVLAALIAGVCGCSSYDAAVGADGDAGALGPVNGTPMNPRLELGKLEDVVLTQGSSVTVKITFRRGDVGGPVTLAASELPAGVSAPDVVVPPGAVEASVQLTAMGSAAQGKSSFVITASSPINGQAPAFATASTSLLVRGGRGAIDTSFGEGGRLGAIVGPALDSTAMALTLYPDDRIGLAVTRESTGKGYAIRTTRDGALDPSFGAGGRQELTHLPSAANADAAGNLYTAGSSGNLKTLVRLKSDGGLDGSFAEGAFNFGGNLGLYPFQAYSMSIVGTEVRVYGDYYSGTGSIDSNLPLMHKVSTSGQRLTGQGYGFDRQSSSIGMATADDGRAIVAGYSYSYRENGATNKPAIAILRTNVDGSIDKTFAGGGNYSLYPGIWFAPQSGLALQYGVRPSGIVLAPDRRILVPYIAAAGVFLARFEEEGYLDVKFGTSGTKGPLITGGLLGQTLALGNEGFLLVLHGLHSIRLAKFDLQGIADQNFGVDGVVTYSFGPNVETQGVRAAMQSDGRVVVFTTVVGTSKEAVLLRFWN